MDKNPQNTCETKEPQDLKVTKPWTLKEDSEAMTLGFICQLLETVDYNREIWERERYIVWHFDS